MRSALPSFAQASFVFYQLQAENLLLPWAGACRNMTSTRENWPKCFDDRLWHRCLSDKEYGDCSSGSCCGCCCQGLWSSDTNLLLWANSKPTGSSRWLCNLLWGKLFLVNVEETHFFIWVIPINLATLTIKCGAERALFKSGALPLPTSQEG